MTVFLNPLPQPNPIALTRICVLVVVSFSSVRLVGWCYFLLDLVFFASVLHLWFPLCTHWSNGIIL